VANVHQNTKDGILSVCDKPYHKIKENIPQWEELDNLWNYAMQTNKKLTFEMHALKF